MGPWDSYAPEDPRGQPANWQPNESGEYRYVGPVDPTWGTVNQANSYVAPGVGGGAPVDSGYYSSANPAYTGGPYTSPNSEYVPYDQGPSVSQQVATSQQPGYGGYDNGSSASTYIEPTPGIFSPVAPGGTFTPQPSDYGPAAGPVDYNYVYNPTTSAAPAGVSQPPAAPGGAAPLAPAAPIATSTDPITGEVVYQSDPYSAPAPGGGGYDQGYGGGSAMGSAPGFTFPDGSGFGAPRQMGANGQFDPFAWAGVSNPRPLPSAAQMYVLQQMGLAPAPPPKPLGPIAYTAAKLGISAPETQMSMPNPMQQMQEQAPPQWPVPPPSMGRQLSTNAPQANAPQLPDLPMLPLPRRGNFRT